MSLFKKLVVGTIFLAGTSSIAYDVVDRFILLEDKFKTEEMVRPYGHDFLLDISAYANKNLLDLVDDVDSVNKETTTAAKLNKANKILSEYDKTEQTMRLNLQFGIPLFTFRAFGAKIVPDIRFGAQFGANVGIRSEAITLKLLLELLDLPPEVESQINANVSQSEVNQVLGGGYGGDLGNFLKNAADVDPIVAAQFDGKAIPLGELDSGATSAPNLAVFTKLDVKAGVLFNFFKKSWTGHLNVYGLHRTDFFRRIDSTLLVNGEDVLGSQDELNSQLFLVTDWKIRKKLRKRYSVSFMLEELKIARLSDNIQQGGELEYEIDPLIRLHADGRFAWHGLSLMPFAGVHKRKAYGFSDGLYIGTDLGAHVWGDRIGLTLRTMLDSEHLTLSPQLKLWFMQLQYSLKQPVKSTVDDVKTSALHSVNIRFFF